MRLMVQALLANRFQLAVHTETRELPVFALALVKPGKMGPRLLPHSTDSYPVPNMRRAHRPLFPTVSHQLAVYSSPILTQVESIRLQEL